MPLRILVVDDSKRTRRVLGDGRFSMDAMRRGNLHAKVLPGRLLEKPFSLDKKLLNQKKHLGDPLLLSKPSSPRYRSSHEEWRCFRTVQSVQ